MTTMYIATATNKITHKTMITVAYDTEKQAVMDLFNQFRDGGDNTDEEGWHSWIEDHINTMADLIELVEEYIAGECRSAHYPFNKNNWIFSVNESMFARR